MIYFFLRLYTDRSIIVDRDIPQNVRNADRFERGLAVSGDHQRDQFVDDEHTVRAGRPAVRAVHAHGGRGFQAVRHAETDKSVPAETPHQGRAEHTGEDQK